MEYVKRVLRILAIVLVSPLIVGAFCVVIGTIPLTYGIICAYFYVKDGENFNHKEADYYTDAVFDFFMEGIWNWPVKYILNFKQK